MAQSIFDLGWSAKGFLQRIETRYWIQDRNGGRYRLFGDLFKYSRPQQEFYRLVFDQMRRGGPVRIIVLKSRKPGISTAIGVLFYDIVTHCEGMRAGVLAHTQESTNTLFNMVDTLWIRTSREIKLDRSKNGTLMRFGGKYKEDLDEGEIGLRSSYECATAGGANPFTGSTPFLVHWSEVGKTQGGRERQVNIPTSVLNALGEPSVAILESTAQGMGNLFHETWLEGQRNIANGRKPAAGEWIPCFIAAQDDPLNRDDVEDGYQWANWPTDDQEKEKRLVDRFGTDSISQEFLRWRRRKIKELRMDFDKFDEDYPTSWEVAFLGSGRPAIDRRLTDWAEQGIRHPLGNYTTQLEGTDEALGRDALTGW